MATKTISKAQQKRDKDLNDRISSLIRRTLKDFKNNYLNDFAKFQEYQLQKKVDFYQGMVEDPKRLENYNNELRSLSSRTKWFKPITAEQIQKGKLSFAKHKMEFPTIRLMNYLVEANQGFETKIDRVVEKVFQYRPDSSRLRIEDVRNIGSEFSFLITNDEMEIHARVIYVNGVVVCPHYRFIVTKRNK
tara:strand:- start:40026 stop:40595 length:570 start_codon:yes stop_codon:yes gene_type:complete